MRCPRTRTALSARLDQEALPPGVTERGLAEHLAGCPDCRSWQSQIEQLKRMPPDEPDSGAESAERLMERLRHSELGSGPDERGTSGSGRHAC